MRQVDTIILGGGCIGAAIFQEFTKQGLSQVLLVDNGRKSSSATAHSGGMIRVFHENPEHINLALQNFSLLKEYEKMRIVEDMPKANGSLYFFHRSRLKNWMEQLSRIEKAGYEFEILSANQGKFPEFQWKKDELAIYEPQGGVLEPKRFTEKLIQTGINLGGELLDDTEVFRLTNHQGKYALCTSKGVVLGRNLVLAGGARLLPRLGDLGLQLPLFPKEIFAIEGNSIGKELPNYFDRETLEFGRLQAGLPTILSDANTQKISLYYSASRELRALDCYSPGRLGVLGQAVGQPNLYIAMGWGGTALKFSLAIAKNLTQLVSQKENRIGMHYV